MFPVNKYSIIYADPAWKFQAGGNRGADKHYKLMSRQELIDLPVPSIASDNCILFLWTTSPTMEQSIELMKAWGFKYKTVGFTWVKKNKVSDSFFFGMGYWTRKNPEYCLIGVKGKMRAVSHKVAELQISRVREHSRKPDYIRDLIVELCGDLPRIELFSRQKVAGWDNWGDESDKFSEVKSH
jgi:N6-adenosine-specific RNA methylase IME4